MGWQRSTVAAAIQATLTAASEGSVSVFADPPATFNVPAFIVPWPDVTYNDPVFGVDLALQPVLVAVAPDQSAQCDALLHVARAALEADPTLGGALAHGTLTVRGERNWRITDVAGARYLLAELLIEIRM